MLLKFIEDHRTSLSIAVGIGLGSAAVWYISHKLIDINSKKRKIPTTWEEVGTVTQLLIYPVKSAKAVAVQAATATRDGLEVDSLRDRSFMVITVDHRMVTGRECGVLVTLLTNFKDSKLEIVSLAGDSVRVDLKNMDQDTNVISMKLRGNEVRGVDCGDEVATWLTKVLFDGKKKVRLLYVGSVKFPRVTRTNDFFKFPNMYEGDTTLFNDSTSYNIATEASLDELNSRLDKPVSIAYFRSPIVIGGTKPYDEDNWSYVKIGDHVVLHMAKPCDRCALTLVDPETGNKREDHMKELRKYRIIVHPEALAKQWATRPIFSVNCGIDATGDIKVGDKVFVHRYDPYWRVNGSANG